MLTMMRLQRTVRRSRNRLVRLVHSCRMLLWTVVFQARTLRPSKHFSKVPGIASCMSLCR